jgi:hypothetical protein
VTRVPTAWTGHSGEGYGCSQECPVVKPELAGSAGASSGSTGATRRGTQTARRPAGARLAIVGTRQSRGSPASSSYPDGVARQHGRGRRLRVREKGQFRDSGTLAPLENPTGNRGWVVPEVGLEPTLAEANTALNRARLPIPPLRREQRKARVTGIGRGFKRARSACPAEDDAALAPGHCAAAS